MKNDGMTFKQYTKTWKKIERDTVKSPLSLIKKEYIKAKQRGLL